MALALTDVQIEELWKNTFSTNNPFCPCDLRTFTKTARAVESKVRALMRPQKGDRQ